MQEAERLKHFHICPLPGGSVDTDENATDDRAGKVEISGPNTFPLGDVFVYRGTTDDDPVEQDVPARMDPDQTFAIYFSSVDEGLLHGLFMTEKFKAQFDTEILVWKWARVGDGLRICVAAHSDPKHHGTPGNLSENTYEWKALPCFNIVPCTIGGRKAGSAFTGPEDSQVEWYHDSKPKIGQMSG
jgi:hypothetical protein